MHLQIREDTIGIQPYFVSTDIMERLQSLMLIASHIPNARSDMCLFPRVMRYAMHASIKNE
jgi:hypothetical protein